MDIRTRKLISDDGIPNTEDVPWCYRGTYTMETAPTIDAGDCDGRLPEDWEFTNIEEFRVRQKEAGSDIWLVGRRGKTPFPVSKRDLGIGLGRPYHYQGIPWKLVALKIEREETRISKEAERAAFEEEISKLSRRIKEGNHHPRSFWYRLTRFFHRNF